MRKYYRHFRRMEPWAKLTMWVEKGYMKPPANYNLLKLFPPRQYAEDFPGYNKKVKSKLLLSQVISGLIKSHVQVIERKKQIRKNDKITLYENDCA